MHSLFYSRIPFQKLRSRLDLQPSQLDSLKRLLQTVKDINEMVMPVEEELEEINECYRLLRLHRLPVGAGGEFEEVQRVRDAWHSLRVSCRTAERKTLSKVTFQFMETTRREVVKFQRSVDAFYAHFIASGPGAVGEDLDKGLQLLMVIL